MLYKIQYTVERHLVNTVHATREADSVESLTAIMEKEIRTRHNLWDLTELCITEAVTEEIIIENLKRELIEVRDKLCLFNSYVYFFIKEENYSIISNFFSIPNDETYVEIEVKKKDTDDELAEKAVKLMKDYKNALLDKKLKKLNKASLQKIQLREDA